MCSPRRDKVCRPANPKSAFVRQQVTPYKGSHNQILAQWVMISMWLKGISVVRLQVDLSLVASRHSEFASSTELSKLYSVDAAASSGNLDEKNRLFILMP